MVFNGDANGQDIYSIARKFAGKATTISFPIKDAVMYANMGLREIWGIIFAAYAGWHYDDNNNTDLPEATGQLNANETFVALPVDSHHLLSVAYKDTGGNWNPVKPITIEQINDMGYAENEFMNTPGNPVYYRPVANGFKPYPAANFTQAASWGIWISRDVSAFTVTDTSKQPGFDSTLHEGLSIYMALQHSKINQLPQAGGRMKNGSYTGLMLDWSGFSDRITNFYANRFRQLFPPHIRHRDVVREYQ